VVAGDHISGARNCPADPVIGPADDGDAIHVVAKVHGARDIGADEVSLDHGVRCSDYDPDSIRRDDVALPGERSAHYDIVSLDRDAVASVSQSRCACGVGAYEVPLQYGSRDLDAQPVSIVSGNQVARAGLGT